MKKKRITAAITAAMMSLSFVSCSDKSDESSSKESTLETNISESTEKSAETTKVNEENDSEDLENPYGTTADINEFIDSADIDPPLWKVIDPDSGNSIYLLGTIHMLPKDVSDYPSDLMDIYDNCDSIAVEYDIIALSTDANAQMEYLNGMIYSDGSTIKDHI